MSGHIRGNQGRPVAVQGAPHRGAVAAGSTLTCDAAARALRLGGTAIDAAVSGAFAATVAEPTLASLGGGGFCLHAEPGSTPRMTDFFVDMPGHGGTGDTAAMESLSVTFSSDVRQEFHVGWASVATPGTLAGLLALHARGGQLPLSEVIAPAREAARDGIQLDDVQVSFIRVIGPILQLTPQSAALFGPPLEGRPFRNPEYAVLLEALAEGGTVAEVFAGTLAGAMGAHGGIVTRSDMAAYEVVDRAPLRARRGGNWIWTNPPPAFGGAIVLESLGLMPEQDGWAGLPEALLSSTGRHRAAVTRGTTHLSVIDGDGRVAALSLSNGSNSGTVVSGVSLNNMLGEADLHPAGFHSLPAGQRLSSMMAPTLVTGDDGSLLALGTGGSERIRSALVQVLMRVIDGDEDIADAVAAPRLHASDDLIDIEPGFPDHVVAAMREGHPPVREWPAADLYFGGVHAVRRDPDGRITAAADRRRGGAVALV